MRLKNTMIEIISKVASKLNIDIRYISATLNLLNEGATIPFIARYRKDKTNGLDEVQIETIQKEASQLEELATRKKSIIDSIQLQGKLTDELHQIINLCENISVLEDLYLPYKPKRKTKASIAKERGLAPLADLLLMQEENDIETQSNKYLTAEVLTTNDALQGARDIIAEQISETPEIRQTLRNLFNNKANLQCKVVEEKADEAIKYKDYFDYNQLAKEVPGHRFLAMFRANTEQLLTLSIYPDTELALSAIEKQFVKNKSQSALQVAKACKESYNRLLKLSLELALKMEMKNKADEEAILVFAENLRQLLLASPLGNKVVMAIDPGFKSGCKMVVLSDTGKLIDHSLFYIHDKNKWNEAEQIVRKQVANNKVQAIAIGNGTAGRETEQFIKQLDLKIPLFLVNEDGASVYSASAVAREEFPTYDVTVRGAISIGRRLQNPLAELVKIEPKSIGVGQYQHDVNQIKLKQKLDATIISCVNKVGVDVNTASKQLLSYVSGIGETLAHNIVEKRNENGGFKSREELKSIPRMGEKAFEQSAGFLRILNSNNPLDASALHPESYSLALKIMADNKLDLKNVIGKENALKEIDLKPYIDQAGKHTITDLVTELGKPGADPRSTIEVFEFANIYSIEAVKTNDILPGVVTNLTKFGAFVDIGIKQDGLVHISEIANRFIKDPAEILQINQKVNVKVLEVDIARNRILLSIKQAELAAQKTTPKATTKYAPATLEGAMAELLSKFSKS
jgi:uncharacterized protein